LKNQKYSGKIKILHLSDIHLGPIYQYESSQKIVNEINSLNPDIVIITGDFVDGTLKISQEMLNPFDTLTIPILYVTGNHEVMYGKEEFLKLISNTRIKHIGNSNFEYKNVNFIGADWEDDLDSIIYKNKDNNNVNVLVAHAPLKFQSDLIDSNIFLMLCGHTHGGQLFPFNVFAYFFNRCFKGLYSTTDEKNPRFVYVSEGVNTAMVPMRVGSHRIFGLITIEGEKNNFNEKIDEKIDEKNNLIESNNFDEKY
jgi:predicted MPP superfamily phosphohydrolase